MGQSKKKLKRKAKHEQRAGPKAKKKAIKARQIDSRNKLRKSKREAAALQSKKEKPPVFGDLDEEVSLVDKLFENFGEGEEEETRDDVSEASSAGAFHEVGNLDDELEDLSEDDVDQEELEGLGADPGAKHAEELKALKEKDPDFYKFLVEQDKALLDFRVPEADEDEGEEDEEAEEEEGRKGKAKSKAADKIQQQRVLTVERLHHVQNSAMKSYTACKAALNIYHTAVRSIQAQEDDEQKEKREELRKDGKVKKPQPDWIKKKKRAKKSRPGLLEIQDEAIFSSVIEWSLANMLPALRQHAGEPASKSASQRAKKKKLKKGAKQQQEDEEDELDGTHGLLGIVAPNRHSRWGRVRLMTKIFWGDTFYLLNHMTNADMMEYALRHLSTPQAISWLWPFNKARSMFMKKCCMIWSSAPSQNVRLLAFVFIKNSGTMALHVKEKGRKKQPMLDELIRQLVKGFAQAASMGYNWRLHNTFRFMENCFVEMLRLDDGTAYRIGYVCLRQLALLLRNACLPVAVGDGKKKGQKASKARGKSSKALTEKQKKRKSTHQQAVQSLVAWPFVRALYLWTKAVGTLPSLRELAYPLSMIILGAVKSNVKKLQNFPFVYHCLVCQNRLASQLEVFVPISSHVLCSFGVLQQALDKAYKKHKATGKETVGLQKAKAPELEVITHFGEGQLLESMTLETMGLGLTFLLIDHFGMLSRSPAFPELVTLVEMHMKKHLKHCPSATLRRQFQSFLTASSTTTPEILARRDNMEDIPGFKKFLIFAADTPMAKMREDMLKKKADEERMRIEVETQPKSQRRPQDVEREQKKRKKKQEGAKEESKPQPKKRRKAGPGEAAEEQREDKVEEMGFSSEED